MSELEPGDGLSDRKTDQTTKAESGLSELRDKIAEIISESRIELMNLLYTPNLQVADKIIALINEPVINIELEHKQCHSCKWWRSVKALGSFCANPLIININKNGDCMCYCKVRRRFDEKT